MNWAWFLLVPLFVLFYFLLREQQKTELVFADTDRQLARTSDSLADNYERMGRPHEAVPWRESAVKQRKRAVMHDRIARVLLCIVRPWG